MNQRKASKIGWMVVIILCMSVMLFASGVKVQVVFQDGLTSGVGEISKLEDGVLYLQGPTGENLIPLQTIGAIYFIVPSSANEGFLPDRSYRLGGSVYTMGSEEGAFAAYGPSGLKITDAQFLQDLMKLDTATARLRDPDLLDRLGSYQKTILLWIGLGWVQKNLASVRDMGVNVAANAVATLFHTGTPVELAVRVGVDLTTDKVQSLMDPATYLYTLTTANLLYLSVEMGILKGMVEQIPTGEGLVLDGDHLLETISKYFMIFSLYQPTLDFLDAMTPSGALDEQLKEVGETIAKKVVGSVGSMAEGLVMVYDIEKQIRESFAHYDTYCTNVERFHAELKSQMPFLDEQSTVMKEYLGFFVVEYGTKVVNAPTPEQREQQFQGVLQTLHETLLLPPSLQNPWFTPTRLGELYRTPVGKREEAGMVLVHGGTFQRGNTRNDSEGNDIEKPVHTVHLTYDYWLGRYEVTFAEYDAFCDATGRSKPDDEGWTRGTRPVINVSWNDAVAYCNWMSEQQGLPKAYDASGNLLDANGSVTSDIRRVYGYRLPTEAEWEYAARGGHASAVDFQYAGSNNLDEVGFYSGNSGLNGFKSTQEVGKKLPNELGLYDMSGNVWEWCTDWYGKYLSEVQENPIGPRAGSYRVGRGGCWCFGASNCRVADRDYGSPGYRYGGLGLRLARTY